MPAKVWRTQYDSPENLFFMYLIRWGRQRTPQQTDDPHATVTPVLPPRYGDLSGTDLKEVLGMLDVLIQKLN